MVKHIKNDKIQECEKKRIVKRYYCENLLGNTLACEEGISKVELGEWVHRYLSLVKEEVKMK